MSIFFRKNCRLHDRLIVKIHVARVENRATLGAQQDSGGSENVACVEEFECQCVCLALRCTFAGD